MTYQPVPKEVILQFIKDRGITERNKLHDLKRVYYKQAMDEGWLDDYLPRKNKPYPRTLEECRKRALKFKTRRQFWRQDSSAAKIAWDNGWIDSFEWLTSHRDLNSKIHCVYVYTFPELNYAYVGRTVDIKQRHYDHFNKENEATYKFIKQFDINDIPEPTIICDKLKLEESRQQEDKWIKKYKEDGWNMINTAKAGSIGSLIFKWSKNVCYNIAHKYLFKEDFKKCCQGAYITALYKNWMKDYTWLRTKKEVIVYDINGKYFNSYPSLIEFARTINCSEHVASEMTKLNDKYTYKVYRILDIITDFGEIPQQVEPVDKTKLIQSKYNVL